MANNLVEINEKEFMEQVINNPKAVLLDFYAPWCEPCQSLMPEIEKMAAEFAGKIDFFKMNVEQTPQITVQFGIMSVPNLLFFKGGKIVGQMMNDILVDKVRKKLEQLTG